jgi:M6 family metalloprotease-like protein
MGALVVHLHSFTPVAGMSASTRPFRELQPTGDMTPDLFLRGNPKFHYMTDSHGFAVIQNENKTFVFAAVDEHDGDLIPTEMVVGETNPMKMSNMTPNTFPELTMQKVMCGRLCQSDTVTEEVTGSMFTDVNITAKTTGSRKNLVLLIRFADHLTRKLPPANDFNKLFNNVLPGSPITPAGGVRHYFHVNSYGTLDLESVIYGWIALPENEAYYADGQSGLSETFPEALFDALDAIDAGDFPWSDFDMDNDGVVDSLTLIHSGYGAEWGQTDEDGQTMHDRIWSHHWTLPRSKQWRSSSGLQVDKYVVCPGLWDTKGSEIGRMGVIVHELGHYLGLPDLYGSGITDDNGIGSYGVMGNSWGFDNSQSYPPHMCPWSKMTLGWSRPILISQGGDFDIQLSAMIDHVYRIDLGRAEYLLIENRQPQLFDAKLPAGGLAIWHIDEAASHLVPGFPTQDGWPTNGKHYKVALLPADGKYDLEKGVNFGDSGDVFRAGGVSTLTPSNNGGKYPNTDAYQASLVKPTGVTIKNISASSSVMKFTVTFANEALRSPAPSPKPAGQTPSSTKELVAGFAAGSGGAGNMFDVVAKKDLVVTEFAIHSYATTMINVEVWSKLGSFQGSENSSSNWQMIKSDTVLGKGLGQGTHVRIPNIGMNTREVRAFYITVASGGTLAYTKGQAPGAAYVSNDDIQIMEGIGKAYPFGATYTNRKWNGILMYEVGQVTTIAPTSSTSLASTPSLNPFNPPSIDPSFTKQSLTTTWKGGTGQDGNMFDILPTKNVMITGFDLHLTYKQETTVEIFTKVDSFRGYENVCANWTRVAHVVLVGQGTGSATSVPPRSFDPIYSERFRVRSFYITVVSSQQGGMRYTVGNGTVGSPIARDDSLIVFGGIGKNYPCKNTFQDRIWNGAIQYTILDKPLEITTDFFGGNQAAGVIFDVVASKAMRIVGMEVHVASKKVVSLEVYIKSGSYAGYENRRDSWNRVANTTVMGQGIGERSVVPANAFNPVTVDRNATVAFYVTFKESEMRYSSGGDFTNAASNDDMIVTRGIGRDYPFGNMYPDRAWNGVFKYELI